jgi:hypothetical protein
VFHLPLLTAAFLGLLAARAFASEASLAPVASTSLYLLGWIFIPGTALWRVLRTRVLDPVGELAVGGALGTAALITGFFALRRLELLSFFPAWPLVALPLLAAARPRPPVTPDGAPATRGSALIALGLCVGMLLAGTSHTAPSRWWHHISNDDLFHAANAAEVLRPPPMQDPRVAGLPFNYHSFAYALPAGLEMISGAPVGQASNLLLAGFGPALLALLLHALARSLARSAWAGVAAAGILALHADLDAVLRMPTFWETKRLGLGATLTVGVTDSLTTCIGLIFTAVLILLLHHHLAAGGDMRSLAGLALVGFVASGTKGSVMPIVVAGLAAAWVAGVRRGRSPAGLRDAVLATGLAALPITLQLALGDHSYARAMFTLDPLATLARSNFFKALGAEDGGSGRRLILLIPWLAGYLGPSGWLATTWLLRRRGTTETIMGWIAFAGIAAALAVRAPGHSQLFFAYTGLIAVIGLAGRAMAGEKALPRKATATLLVLGFPFLLAGLTRIQYVAARDRHERVEEPPRLAAWREGLTWLREHAEPGAVVASRSGTMVVAALTERRSLFDLARFTPQGHAATSQAPPFPEHRTAVKDLYTAPDVSTLTLVRSLAPRAPVLYVVCDDVESTVTEALGLRLKIGPRPECRELAAASAFEVVYTNTVMAVYRARLH